MSSIITFAADNEFFHKRKRVFRACEACKKRRKRCDHTFENMKQSSPGPQPVPNKSAGTSKVKDITSSLCSNEEHGDDDAASDESVAERIRSPETETPSGRFIGDLNPEAVLRGSTRKRGRVEGSNQSTVGFFVKEPRANQQPSSIESPGLSSPRVPIYTTLSPPHLQQKALLDIWLRYIQPLLPILDAPRFLAAFENGLASPRLIQAICMIACRHDSARPYLMLPTSGTLLQPRDFAERLHKSIVSAMHTAPEPDKLTSIRIRALLSLQSEGFEGAEQASEHLILAIHQAHSVGLHIGRSMTDDKDESLEKVFWCLWSLDKLNAITNGRPTIIKDQDTGISITTENQEARHTPFGIWLQIASLLDEVIAFYRPATDPAATGWEHDFPSFEALMGSSSEAGVDPGVITTLELFYHAVAMLSHRARSIQDPARATASHTRQSLAAVRATLILKRNIPDGFSPLPIVPYAISLSLAVAYRQYRQSRLTSYQERAKEEIEACCELLQSLENIWWSAGVMADLGRGALKKVDKVSRAGKVPKANSTARVGAVKPAASTLLLATTSGKTASYLPSHPDHHQDLVTTDFNPNGLWGPQSLDGTSSSTDVFGVPSQHPTSSERADQSVTDDLTDWMSPSFFDNFDDFLGSYPTLAFPTGVTGYEQ